MFLNFVKTPVKRELRIVKEERDILKKAVGYFAKPPQ